MVRDGGFCQPFLSPCSFFVTHPGPAQKASPLGPVRKMFPL